MAMSSKEMRGMSQHTDPKTLVYYQYGNRDQLDALFIPYVADVLGPTFRMFDQSVCFKNRTEKNKFNGVRPVGYPEGASIAKTCVCLSKFKRISRSKSERPHVALIEGKIGRIDPSKIRKNVIQKLVDSDSSEKKEHEFHCCMLIVDNESVPGSVHVFNPWKEGQARSGIVTRVVDIRPRLVKELVARYKGFNKFHLSGDQVWTSDCRIRVAKFAKKLGANSAKGISYKSALDWVKIK